jgi:hypothetical protein
MRNVLDKRCTEIPNFFSVIFPPNKSCLLLNNMEKYGIDTKATDDNMGK